MQDIARGLSLGGYGLFLNNCGDVVRRTLDAGGVDPNFPNTINPEDTLPYLRNPQNGWRNIPLSRN